MNELQYSVSGMTCDHCVNAITKEVNIVPDVVSVNVDLATKIVTVIGTGIDDVAVRAAISEAGYEIEDDASPR